MDVVGLIMEYEGGDISEADFLALFGHLIATGQAWQLQGHYGRTAAALIAQGYISDSGEVLVS